jgi:hypothetical protein
MSNEFSQPIKTKGAAPNQENAPFEDLQSNDNKSLKWRTTLSHLLRGPRHRFDAERWGDHALHSTVSGLERDHGLHILRDWRAVPTRFGKTCRVKAYWVADLSRANAMRLVAKHRAKKIGG